MKLVDKVVATLIAAFLLAGVAVYVANYDMYDMVGNYNAIGGYGTLVERLKDESWVEASVVRWEQSSSPVMHCLFQYLTDASDASPIALIQNNRLILVVGLLLSVASWPLCLAVHAGRVNVKRLKEIKAK